MELLITGGAGFIGCNAAARFLKKGYRVTVLDNLSRRGTQENLAWLKTQGAFVFVQGDIRDRELLVDWLRCSPGLDAVLHLAAQVAVTTSVTDPRQDFEINALGTFNLLEAVRLSGCRPLVIYSSTNKVYGAREEERVEIKEGRWSYGDLPLGVSEEALLDFHSPYGCSKGAADQYVRDYSRIYGIPTVVLRQSCIYGPHQFGLEDQGWVAWFTLAAMLSKHITIYGDGHQSRDILAVEDLVNVYETCMARPDAVAGRIFNVGGGPRRVVSLLEVLKLLEEILGRHLTWTYEGWRPGDQKVYVSDVRRLEAELGWRPQVGPREGLERLVAWIDQEREMLERVLG